MANEPLSLAVLEKSNRILIVQGAAALDAGLSRDQPPTRRPKLDLPTTSPTTLQDPAALKAKINKTCFCFLFCF